MLYSAVHGQYKDGPEQAVKDKKQKLQPQHRANIPIIYAI